MVSWQLRIFIKLNLSEKSHKIISDETGVLSTKTFTRFLSDNQVAFSVTDKIPDMLSIVSKKESMIIITGIKEIPDFISNKYEHLKFTYADIPLNGQIQTLISKLSVEPIINLLDYCYKDNPHIFISNENFNDLVLRSVQNARDLRVDEIVSNIKSVLSDESDYKAILQLGKLIGELIFLPGKHSNNHYLDLIPLIDSYSEKFVLTGKMDDAFFASRSDNPVTVDKILHHIRYDKNDKSALLCFDCMGWAEWFILKEFLQGMNLSYEESELFALLPTVTSISRSAIFQGSMDVYNIKATGRVYEEKAFSSFFSDKETKYFTEKDTINEDTLLGFDCISILFTFFDDLAHSAEFWANSSGKLSYFYTILVYLKDSNFKQIIGTLIQNGFSIYICSDHGSIVSIGNGHRIEKYLIDSFSKRACIIPETSSELTELKKVRIPFISDKLMILPEGREMFTYKGKQEINHGGITVEEMVVPYIKIKN